MQVFVERPVHHFTLGPPWPCSTVEQAVLPCVLWLLGRLPAFPYANFTKINRSLRWEQRHWIFTKEIKCFWCRAPCQPDQTFSSRVQSKVCGLSAAWSPNCPLGTFFNFCHVLWVFLRWQKELNTLQPKENWHKPIKLWHIKKMFPHQLTIWAQQKKRKWNEMQTQVKHKTLQQIKETFSKVSGTASRFFKKGFYDMRK